MTRRARWSAYVATGLLCAAYLNAKSAIAPRWGQWFTPGTPFVNLQVRAFLSGRLALVPTSYMDEHDFVWGRGGLHQAWGLGLPILATPFHLLGRIFGAPGFPDALLFLILYTVTVALLARALHGTAGLERGGAASSLLAAGFVATFPAFVGLITSRFLVFEQAIATGVLWNAALLAGTLLVVERCTATRVIATCAAAGFSIVIRAPLAVYGVTTLLLTLLVARRRRMPGRVLVLGGSAFAAVVLVFYFACNERRFGSPFNFGYGTVASGYVVNRLTRWSLPFAKAPIWGAAKELFAELFLLEPVPSQTMDPPLSVKPYIVPLERWREFYSPSFDLFVFAALVCAAVLTVTLVVYRRLWRPHEDLASQRVAVIGVWGLLPSLVLFAFYSRVPNLVTRYLMDFAPAFAASALCAGMGLVEALTTAAPELGAGARLVLAGLLVLYYGEKQEGWPTHMAPSADAAAVKARLDQIDSIAKRPVAAIEPHAACGAPRGPPPVHEHFEEWRSDCTFASGMVFAFPYSACVSFTFRAPGPTWTPDDDKALAGLRATADFDDLVSCGSPTGEGPAKRATLCEPRKPPFLLEGMRLYSIATLDSKLAPIDRLKLLAVDTASSCPVRP